MKQELENMKSLFDDFISAANAFIENEKQNEKSVAGWYKYNYDDELTKSLAYSSNGKYFDYGFSISGVWNDKFIDCKVMHNDMVLADPKEVKQRLIEEVERITGVTYLWYDWNGNRLIASNSHYPNQNGIITLFNNGKWAEIIKEPLTLNGKKVVVNHEDNSILIFDNCFELSDFKDLVCHCNGYDIEGINKHGETYLISDLKQLLTKIEENENK